MPNEEFSQIPNFLKIFFIVMYRIADFLNSAVNNYHIDGSTIQYVQGRLNEDRKVIGWISLILNNRECIVMKFNNGVFINQVFLVNEQKVLKVIGNHQIGAISYNDNCIVEEGIVDLDHGSRFEGLVLKEREREGQIGIPFGYGEMYDDDGILVYKGIMINWKRFGYGSDLDKVSYMINMVN